MNTRKSAKPRAVARFVPLAAFAAVSLVLVSSTGCTKKHKPATAPAAAMKCQIDMDCPPGGACQIHQGEAEGICVRAGENSPNAAPGNDLQGPGMGPGKGPGPAPMPSVTASPNDIQL